MVLLLDSFIPVSVSRRADLRSLVSPNSNDALKNLKQGLKKRTY
jgi:hypothetical protein